MKKLKLKALQLGAKEIMTRDQLKKVFGGGSASGCAVAVSCGSGTPKVCECEEGTCSSGNGSVTCDCVLTGSTSAHVHLSCSGGS